MLDGLFPYFAKHFLCRRYVLNMASQASQPKKLTRSGVLRLSTLSDSLMLSHVINLKFAVHVLDLILSLSWWFAGTLELSLQLAVRKVVLLRIRAKLAHRTHLGKRGWWWDSYRPGRGTLDGWISIRLFSWIRCSCFYLIDLQEFLFRCWFLRKIHFNLRCKHLDFWHSMVWLSMG